MAFVWPVHIGLGSPQPSRPADVRPRADREEVGSGGLGFTPDVRAWSCRRDGDGCDPGGRGHTARRIRSPSWLETGCRVCRAHGSASLAVAVTIARGVRNPVGDSESRGKRDTAADSDGFGGAFPVAGAKRDPARHSDRRAESSAVGHFGPNEGARARPRGRPGVHRRVPRLRSAADKPA